MSGIITFNQETKNKNSMPLYDYQCKECNKVVENIILTLVEHEHPELVHELHCYCKKQGTIMLQAYLIAPSVITMTKNRIQTDMRVKRKVIEERKKRSTDHFKKEVFPTINGKDKVHFAKKHSIKM
jgi:hypothetical protein